jgi:hypothetical protein
LVFAQAVRLQDQGVVFPKRLAQKGERAKLLLVSCGKRLYEHHCEVGVVQVLDK